ncbi:tRNA dimethylallyltransferase 9 [Apostasia shenzhenica]|uniref:tRNA dimethylallyltransferase n=1 Tax=Apostasia shenzhenica TaxID=1088818 RepID=A0A2I0AUL8_9ASPA|nr:tRNA dimethylallyltransferase 9 [Apostasia shenzhenica]
MSKAGGLRSWGIMRLAMGLGLRRRPTCSFLLQSSTSISSSSSPLAVGSNGKKKDKVIVIAGPTGAGKSRLALELAKKINGEIISADSVQVYRGLDVGSSKPSAADRREVPHHLLDLLLPSEEYSAGKFFEDARKATEEVITRGKVPLVAGGTGLYLRWYIYGKPDVPMATSELSSEVCSELIKLQEEGKWDEAVELVVAAGDPKARFLPTNNWYRLRRSLEVIRASGSPPSAFALPYDSFKGQPEFEERKRSNDLVYDFLCLFLTSPRIDLYRSIDLRCEEMLMETDGLLSEASWLLDNGLLPNMNSATRAIGYRQAMEFLLNCRNRGGRSTAECFFSFLYEFQKSSRNFAKRQLTWFRHELIYHWLDASRPLESVVDFAFSAYREKEEGKVVVVPKNLEMRVVNPRQENHELKCYRAKNRIFRDEADCQHVLDWILRSQRRAAA